MQRHVASASSVSSVVRKAKVDQMPKLDYIAEWSDWDERK